MNEDGPTIGGTLRTTREARGLSIQDAANRLRLMNRQIVAMETNDFASLGQPVFVRGFVRNYARLLGLDPKAILEIVGGENVQPLEVTPSSSVVLPGAWFTSGWLITGLLALLALVIIPIGLYAWLSSDAEEITPAAIRTAPPAVPYITPAAAPVTPAIQPASPESDRADSLAEKPETLPPVAPATPQVAANNEMNFEFGEDAWVDVRDGTGQILHRHMNGKGTTLALGGQPPFTLVLGNAASIRMTYKGRPVDLAPYIDGNVARFSLEE